DETLARRTRRAFVGAGHRIEPHFEDGEVLSQTVVHLPADLPTLFVLRSQEMEREFAERCPGVFESLTSHHPLGNVAGYLGKSEQVSGVVLHGSDDHVSPKTSTVLANAPAFVLDAAIPGSFVQQALRLVVLHVLFGIKAREMPADNFGALIAFGSLSARVPRRNAAFEVERENCVVVHAGKKKVKEIGPAHLIGYRILQRDVS